MPNLTYCRSLCDVSQQQCTSIQIVLPVTCAFIPREMCFAAGIFSCSLCDQYRLVMESNGTYKGKSQQEYKRQYKCQAPNKSVLISLVDQQQDQRMIPSPDEEMSPSDSQGSTVSSISLPSTSTHHNLRKRKAQVYEIPDSSSNSSDSEDPHFERLVKSVVQEKQQPCHDSLDVIDNASQAVPVPAVTDAVGQNGVDNVYLNQQGVS
jgi:hypothetical protein